MTDLKVLEFFFRRDEISPDKVFYLSIIEGTLAGQGSHRATAQEFNFLLMKLGTSIFDW